jgi:hypothetical protein
MRRSLLRGLLVLATTASIGLVTVATTAANAATSHSSHPQTVNSARLSAPAAAPAQGTVSTVAVSPRLSVPGCSRQDGYNGNVQWTTHPLNTYVSTWGELWDVCGVTAYLYMSWTDGASSSNVQVGTASADTTTGQNQTYDTFFNPGNISVTVCANTSNGWTCGTPYKV